MFERIIENYKYAKANLNSIRFKQKYIFVPILLSFCILDLITCLVLLAKVKNPTVIILVLIGVMFYISTTGSTPTVLNYEKALQNRYATWEQELEQRESEIREKEKELLLSE